MSSPLDPLSEGAREKVRQAAQPEWTDPMLATLVDDAFSDPDWIFERRLDGVRLLAFRDGDEVRLLSRNRERRTATYPEVAEALAATAPRRFVADGEVVAFQGGRTSFSRLQGRMKIEEEEEARASGIAVHYYLFDLLHLEGHDVTGAPLRERKKLLRAALDFADPIRYLRHRNAAGEAFLEEACGKGWEGLIAKRADSLYVGARSRDWLKFKSVNRQEFVIGGFTEPEGRRAGFGALLIGYHEDGRLRYAGKVGTGYDDQTLRELRDRMDALERKTSPFEDEDSLPRKEVHWITPRLVAEVGFTEWTDAGKLRHPRYVGLREDKDPGDVVRERPK